MLQRKRNIHARSACPARMLLNVRDGSWLVTEFNDEHNHPLIKQWSLTTFLRSHKDIPQEDKDLITLLHSVCLEISRQMQIMAELHASLGGIGYTPKDMANFRATLHVENRFTDMQDTMEYFENLKLQRYHV